MPNIAPPGIRIENKKFRRFNMKKMLKRLQDIAIYKFGIISPVLHDSVVAQAEYFRNLSANGIRIPPDSGDIYYLKPSTIKAWLRKYKREGLDGLKYKERSDKGNCKKVTPRIKEAIAEIQRGSVVVSVSDLYRKLLLHGIIHADQVSYETIRKYIKDNGLFDKKAYKQRKKFQKQYINELWMVDFKQGKSIRCGRSYRRTYLCAIIDDASRMLVGYEWGLNEDTVLFARALKKAIMIYGTPKILYCDRGKVFLSKYIVQICGRLGIALAHSQPYQPASRGKIERFNRSVGQLFYPLIDDFASLSIEQLNREFAQFVNKIYHTRIHAGIGQPPLEKFHQQIGQVKINRVNERQVEQFFLCAFNRKVRLDATVRIHNVDYEVGMKYVGETVEIRFPVDKTGIFYLYENDQPVRQLRPLNLVENANPPHISTSYSRLSSAAKNQETKEREA
jgi:transposase InsO family protein